MIKNNKFLSVSVLLNLLLLAFFSVLYIKEASIQNVQNKIISIVTGKEENTSEYGWYYIAKNSQFDELALNDESIVFVGDSITDMGEFPELFGDINIKNRGVNSDTISGVLNRIENVAKQHPKKIFLMVGTNDLGDNAFEEETINSYKEILQNIKKVSPDTEIYVQSVLPTNDSFWVPGGISELVGRQQTNAIIKKFNTEIKQLSEQENVRYVNLFDSFIDENGNMKDELTIDGLHLSGNGYLLWKSLIEEYLQ